MGQLGIYSALDNRLRADGMGNILIPEDEDAVGASVENILLTRRGERVMRRDFGSRIIDLLFEPVDVQTSAFIRLNTLQDIPRNGEDRIIINKVDVQPDADRGIYEVVILYHLRSLPSRRFEFRRIFRSSGDVS